MPIVPFCFTAALLRLVRERLGWVAYLHNTKTYLRREPATKPHLELEDTANFTNFINIYILIYKYGFLGVNYKYMNVSRMSAEIISVKTYLPFS
jgi:hypothetical protein